MLMQFLFQFQFYMVTRWNDQDNALKCNTFRSANRCKVLKLIYHIKTTVEYIPLVQVLYRSMILKKCHVKYVNGIINTRNIYIFFKSLPADTYLSSILTSLTL